MKPPTARSRTNLLILMVFLIVMTSGCNYGGDFYPSPNDNTVHDNGTGAYPGSLPQDKSYEFDLGATGTFTPTQSAGNSLRKLLSAIMSSVFPPMFDEQTGYLAIRVPQAPPAYTLSHITAMTETLVYRMPPTAIHTTAASVALTRRTEYESQVNARFPITDGKSHWEVWWLPNGGHFPVPTGEAAIKVSESPFRLEYSIDFGDGADAHSCDRCTFEYQLYNGFTFIGYKVSHYWIATGDVDGYFGGDSLVTFGGYGDTLEVDILPNETFTQTHTLINLDTVSRTFTLEHSSSQGWNYAFDTQTLDDANGLGAIVPLIGNQVTVEPNPLHHNELRILAVSNPSITASDRIRETFTITATSVISPSVQATTTGYALAPAYQPSEDGNYLFLPIILR